MTPTRRELATAMRHIIKIAALALLPLGLGSHARAAEDGEKVIPLSAMERSPGRMVPTSQRTRIHCKRPARL